MKRATAERDAEQREAPLNRRTWALLRRRR
jgi:hypothetical protein